MRMQRFTSTAVLLTVMQWSGAPGFCCAAIDSDILHSVDVWTLWKVYLYTLPKNRVQAYHDCQNLGGHFLDTGEHTDAFFQRLYYLLSTGQSEKPILKSDYFWVGSWTRTADKKCSAELASFAPSLTEASCLEQHMYLCEFDEGKRCTFDMYENSILLEQPKSGEIILPPNHLTEVECVGACDSHADCWAAGHASQTGLDYCVLYVSPVQSTVKLRQETECNLFIKNCIEAFVVVDGRVIPATGRSVESVYVTDRGFTTTDRGSAWTHSRGDVTIPEVTQGNVGPVTRVSSVQSFTPGHEPDTTSPHLISTEKFPSTGVFTHETPLSYRPMNESSDLRITPTKDHEYLVTDTSPTHLYETSHMATSRDVYEPTPHLNDYSSTEVHVLMSSTGSLDPLTTTSGFGLATQTGIHLIPNSQQMSYETPSWSKATSQSPDTVHNSLDSQSLWLTLRTQPWSFTQGQVAEIAPTTSPGFSPATVDGIEITATVVTPVTDFSGVSRGESHGPTPVSRDQTVIDTNGTSLDHIRQTSTVPSDIGRCECPCAHPTTSSLTKAEKSAMVEKIIESLTINKTQISATRRKYVSASDDRPFSRGVGSVGIAILALVFLTILMLDMISLLQIVSPLQSAVSYN